MASHPLNYEPYPSVNPEGAPGGDFERIDARASAFGADKAAAEEKLGQAGVQAAQQGFEYLDLQGRMDAQSHAAELHSWQSDQVTDAQEKFLQLKGRAALDALPDFKSHIGEIHEQAVGQAANPYTKNLVNQEGRRLTDITYAGAAKHAASQASVYASTTAKNDAASYGNEAAIGAVHSVAPAIADDLWVRNRLDRSDARVREHAGLEGYDGPALEQEVAKNRGVNVRAIVEQTAKEGTPADVQRAIDFYHAQYEKIDAGSRMHIENFLAGPAAAIDGQRLGDQAMGRPPTASPPQIIADTPANFIAGIKNSEGYRSKAYPDGKQYSIGYGTRATSPDEVIDQKEAEARFSSEIGKASKIVDAVNPNLDPGTRAALTSLTYNTGDAWTHSGLGEKIRAGDLQGAKDLFLQYNRVNGIEDQGVTQRRAREASWFGRADVSANEANWPLKDKGTAELEILNNPDLRPAVQRAALDHINKIYGAFRLSQAQDNAGFKLKVENSAAEAIGTGTVQQPIGREEFLLNLGPDVGPKAYDEYQARVQLGADMRTTASLAPNELADMRERYRPQPGDTYVAQANRAAKLEEAIKENETARKKDSAAFLIQRTEVGSQAYQQFQTLTADKKSTPAMQQAYAAMFAKTMIDEQTRLGVDPADIHILPKWYTDDIHKQLMAPDKEGGTSLVAARLQAQASLWGDHWPDVYRQIAPDAEPIVRVIGAGVEPAAAVRLINGMKVKEADLLKNQDNPEAKLKDITQAVDKELGSFFRSIPTAASQRDLTMTDFRTQATKLATLYLNDSDIAGSVSAAATKAAKDLVNFKYDFRDTYRVPKASGVDPDIVQAGVLEAKRMLGQRSSIDHPEAGAILGLSPKGDASFPGRGDADLAQDVAERARINGVWATDTRERGLVLLQPDGNAVRGTNGQAFMLTWAQLKALGDARKAAPPEYPPLSTSP